MKFKSYYIISNKRTRVNSYFALLSDQLVKSDLQENAIHPDLVIIFGGDGSLLRAIKKYHKKIATTYFLLINLGEIGFYDFFANFPKEKIIEALFANKLQIDALDLLKLKHQGEELYALNEIKIIDVARPVRIDIFLNNEYFEHFRGTGLSFATKTGAAGFNKSLGGPVIVSDKPL